MCKPPARLPEPQTEDLSLNDYSFLCPSCHSSEVLVTVVGNFACIRRWTGRARCVACGWSGTIADLRPVMVEPDTSGGPPP